MREAVIIERGDRNNGPGLPRPLAPAKGTLRPVPWTNDVGGWGVLHYDRARTCERQSLCLVCGEVVDEGFIFVDRQHAAVCPVRADQNDLDSYGADNGPLHPRCTKMTVAHCQHMRESILQGGTFIIPYCRQST